MTTDPSALSREEFADYLCGCRTCDAGNMVCEAARRLRVDAVRIHELEVNRDEGMTMLQARNERIEELEAQLAANGKGEGPIAVGDRVRVHKVWSHASARPFDGRVEEVDYDAETALPYKVMPLSPIDTPSGPVQYGLWCDARYVTRLPPEPIAVGDRVADEDGHRGVVVGDDPSDPEQRYHVLYDDGKRGWPATRMLTRLPPEPAKPVDHTTGCQYCGMARGHKMSCYAGPREDVERAAAEGKERRYGNPSGMTLGEHAEGEASHPVVDLARHLQSVLAGVGRVVECLERDKSYPLARMAAAELRGLL